MGLIQNQMNGDGPVPKGPAELNQIQYMQDEDGQKVRGGVTGEGQELSAEDESRINDCIEDAMYGHNVNEKANQIQVVELDRRKNGSHKKTQAPLVRWERFLPVRSLKVLLVENDDSTRHVVSALLRNCGYQVVAVANGLQAWKVLEDLTANIDLVLTEVNLPCETGIGLLSKIMNHRSRKNIPVIMMSSHDSMSIVFKCLSKGAVDFLVKPIRKNELKNLWQHVWRKCQSSSGSGSESGVRTQKSMKSVSAEHSDNKHDNNYDEDDIGSTGLNARDRSDNGSGTHSSWTKMVVEVDSPRRTSPWVQLADQPGSTGAQVTPSTPEETDNSRVALTNETQVGELVLNMVTDKELETRLPRTLTLQPQNRRKEEPSNLSSTNQPKINSEKEKVDEEKEKGQLIEPNIEKQTGKCKNQVADPANAITNNAINPMLEVQVRDNPNGKARCMNDKNAYGYNEVPSLDLRMKPVKDKNAHCYKEAPSFDFSAQTSNTVTFLGSSAPDQNILRHSDNSAFSRYNLASHQAPTDNNSYEAAKTESMQGIQYFNKMPPNQNSNGSNNINDMGSSTIEKPTQKPTAKNLNSSSAFQVVQNSSPQNVPQENQERQHIQVQNHHYHHHHYHHHHHMHNMVANQQINYNGQSVQSKTAPSPHDGSSNVLSAAINSDAGNQSLNGSASGSNHGSNLQVGCNGTLIAGGCNMENGDRIAEKEGKVINGRNFETTNGTIQSRFPQREAALQKFRQKRKERCFEKKVRYQSRKKLAEQRPRVRGQFARQANEENKDIDARLLLKHFCR